MVRRLAKLSAPATCNRATYPQALRKSHTIQVLSRASNKAVFAHLPFAFFAFVTGKIVTLDRST